MSYSQPMLPGAMQNLEQTVHVVTLIQKHEVRAFWARAHQREGRTADKQGNMAGP